MGTDPKPGVAEPRQSALRQAYAHGSFYDYAKIVYQQCMATTPTLPEPAPDDMSIEDLNLGVRTYNRLKPRGYNTLGQITAASVVDLTDISWFGPRQLEDVIKKLYAVGRTLCDLP